MPRDTLTVIDNRTGIQYEIPVEQGAIRATELRQIRLRPDDPGLLSYDPSAMNTALCKSKITYVDRERGVLRYRGYALEDLAENSTYLETAYLIVKGELPDVPRFEAWKTNIQIHTMVHENVQKFMDGYRYDAPPMGMLVGTIGALSTFYPDARSITDLESRRLQTRRLIGKLPTLAAFAYRRTQGLPYVYPDSDLTYAGNFLSMLFKMTELQYSPNPVFERALDRLFILYADHEQSCSTNALRCVASSDVDPFSAVAAAVAALYGPRNGGVQEEVMRMLRGVGSPAGVGAFVKQVRAQQTPLYGFSHREYRAYDPRVRIMKRIAEEVFTVAPRDPLFDVALELERAALQDDYFMSRYFYPNLDYYSGFIYRAIGFPPSMYPVIFAIPRTAGWMAQWAELVRDPEQTLCRPQQIYVGEGPRPWVPIGQRPEPTMREDAVSVKI